METIRRDAEIIGGAATAGSGKPLRYKVGIGLLILYPLLYVVVVVVPFLPLETAIKAGAAGIILAVAEGIFLLGIACVGKEAYQAIRSTLRWRRGRSADEHGDRA